MAGHEPAEKLLGWCLQGGSRAAVAHEVPFPVTCLSWAIAVGGALGCSRSPSAALQVLLDKEGHQGTGEEEGKQKTLLGV